jgi:hypothetical protein
MASDRGGVMIVAPRSRHALGFALAVTLAVALLAGCGGGDTGGAGGGGAGGVEDPLPARTAHVERGTVNSTPNVLVVPTEAVIEQGDRSFVTVPGPSGRPLQVPFQPGAVGDGLTEVKSGLAEGQTILLPFADGKREQETTRVETGP